MPSSDGCDDVVRVCFPDERLRLFIVLFDDAVDGWLKINGRMKDTFFSRRRVSFAKKPSTAFNQEQDVGTKWKVQRGCRANQARTLGCLCVA